MKWMVIINKGLDNQGIFEIDCSEEVVIQELDRIRDEWKGKSQNYQLINISVQKTLPQQEKQRLAQIVRPDFVRDRVHAEGEEKPSR